MQTTKHSRLTRLVHACIAIVVVAQLTTSRFMEEPDDGAGGDLLFEIHEYTGVTGFLLIAALWVTIVVRRRGTGTGRLFPWFSRARLAAVWADVVTHLRAIRGLRLPPHQPDAALPSAVHGLGVLLVTGMASSGLVYFVALTGAATDTAWAEAAEEIHEFLAPLVWAYLLGHAGMALLNHFTGRQSIAEMWSLRRRTASARETTAA